MTVRAGLPHSNGEVSRRVTFLQRHGPAPLRSVGENTTTQRLQDASAGVVGGRNPTGAKSAAASFRREVHLSPAVSEGMRRQGESCWWGSHGWLSGSVDVSLPVELRPGWGNGAAAGRLGGLGRGPSGPTVLHVLFS